jgi:hypothetical protein
MSTTWEERREERLRKSVAAWTQKWKEEGRSEEWQRVWIERWKEEWRIGWLEGASEILFATMEERFGPIPDDARRHVQAIQDPEELKEFGKRLLSASSLSDLLH